jgi:large subunit ribosomal protein L9
MEVILREDVPHLGIIGDVVRVKPGYARNFLLPRGLAVVADKRNLKQLEHQQRVVAARREHVVRAAQSSAQRISEIRLSLKARAGEEGKLYGSVTNIDIEKALAEQGVNVDRRRIRLDEPIKSLGEYRIAIQLGAGVSCEVAISVEPIDEQG